MFETDDVLRVRKTVGRDRENSFVVANELFVTTTKVSDFDLVSTLVPGAGLEPANL